MKQESVVKLLNSKYTPKSFNYSDIDDFLKSNENKINLILRVKHNDSIYTNFDEEFTAYLEKLPDSLLKKSVGILFNKRLVFIGTAKNTEGTVYSRALISKNEKLAGISVNAYALDISLKDGKTPSIDEAIYATYYGLVRAAVIINKEAVKKDKEIQKILTQLIYILMLRVLGKSLSVSSSQKMLLQLICTYLFYRQFHEDKHLRVLKIIVRDYSTEFPKDFMELQKDKIDKFEHFSGFKDFAKMITMFNVADINASQLTMVIVRLLGSNGFYTLIGSLDNLIASLILANYPTEIVGRGFSINSNLQNKLEDRVGLYINKISYEDDFNSLANSSLETI